MKNKLTLVTCATFALLFSSCSVMQNEFSKQRYTRFKTNNDRVTVVTHESKIKEVPVTISAFNTATNEEVSTLRDEIRVTPLSPTFNEGTSKTITHELVSHPQKVNPQPKHVMQHITTFRQALSAKGGDVNAVVLIILCFLLPPLAVYLAKGVGTPFWLDLILTLFFWIPGIIYALIVCL